MSTNETNTALAILLSVFAATAIVVQATCFIQGEKPHRTQQHSEDIVGSATGAPHR